MNRPQDARGRASEFTYRIAERLAVPPSGLPSATSLDQGPWGVALLFAELGHVDSAYRSIAHDWLSAAGTEVFTQDDNGLYQGAPALAFSLTAAARPGDYSEALPRLDDFVVGRVHTLLRQDQERRRSGRSGVRLKSYDLVSGATGLGLLLLRRRSSPTALQALLSYLVELTVPVRGPGGRPTPGWWTPDSPTPGLPTPYPLGHLNLGIAHGVSGVLALLALAWAEGERVPGQTAAITRITEWLLRWGPRAGDSPGAESWQGWPGILSSESGRQGAPALPNRPTWCYGTAGTARAVQLAGVALLRPDWEAAAVEGLTAVLHNPTLTGLVTEPSLCHGWAGVLQATWRVAGTSDDHRLQEQIPAIAEQVMDHLDPERMAGGLLEGLAGVALALHTFATDTEPASGWDRCLALS
ncbi:lanthionine synthetase C family protein [Nocardiopsis sp. NPDC006938]|uniref:lanthionine synthetase C family protein n=1 Tax=Nocardiopsis sp. NPDC006938 TaxID=3364337 RepID=UPI0036C2D8BC